MDIEVGEYIRDRAGNIRRVSRTMPIYENDLLLSNSYYIEFDNLGNVETYRSSYIEEIMTKHSHNIIDLIEVGDIVEVLDHDWIRIFNIDDENILKSFIEDCEEENWKLKGIMSKEIYQSNCYRLED